MVKLSQFVVGASREIDGTAIAINEQRFAPNITNVVSTDEFGAVPEGNIGEFIKFMPSITVEASGGNARWISINGVPPDNVPVMIDGFSLAGTGNAGTGRAADVDMMSINNAARIEVSYSPTPESPGGALACSVNLVPRSSFERSRPAFTGSVYVMMRDNFYDFKRSAGGREGKKSNHVFPGFDFNYIRPISPRFGFTLSAGYSQHFTAQDGMSNTWRGVEAATNGAAFPHTTPDRPYLSSYSVQTAAKDTPRKSLGATIDFKPTPNDRLALSFAYSSFATDFIRARRSRVCGRERRSRARLRAGGWSAPWYLQPWRPDRVIADGERRHALYRRIRRKPLCLRHPRLIAPIALHRRESRGQSEIGVFLGIHAEELPRITPMNANLGGDSGRISVSIVAPSSVGGGDCCLHWRGFA